MRPLDQALAYAEAFGWPVFPCREREPGRKRPRTARGFHDASADPAIIRKWWERWLAALIGLPTGGVSGVVVLDIDVKQHEANGFDTLEDLGHILPITPMAHTGSGGLHCYFVIPGRELKCSAGLIGPGLDIRSTGGYIILPSPGSGYEWDPVYNFATVLPALPPDWLWPPIPSVAVATKPVLHPVSGLSPYGRAAIEGACGAIYRAPAGEQERTLNAECYAIGTLAGAGAGVPCDLALNALLKAGHAMPSHDPWRPWRPEEIDYKVRRAFAAGLHHPRRGRDVISR